MNEGGISQHLASVLTLLHRVKVDAGNVPFEGVKSFSYVFGPLGNKVVCEIIQSLGFPSSVFEIKDRQIIEFFQKEEILKSVFGKQLKKKKENGTIALPDSEMLVLREAYGKLKFCISTEKLKKEFPKIKKSFLEKIANQNKQAIKDYCLACSRYLHAYITHVSEHSTFDADIFSSSMCEILLHIAGNALDESHFASIFDQIRTINIHTQVN